LFSARKAFMNPQPNTHVPAARHRGPNLGIVAIIFTVLFLAGLYPVTMFGGKPYFPRPSESASTFTTFFQLRPSAVLLCAFFHFGAAIALGIFTATVVSQLRFLGARVAGTYIALFGGLATALNITASASVLWVMARPGIAQDSTLVQALYYLQYVFGGPGFSVPLGLLMAGVSIPSAFMKLLPKWLAVFGLFLAVCGELSWLNLLFAKILFLIPLTRFPGFVWLIATGFSLPKTMAAERSPRG
jgi:hypothetical protein